MIALSTRIVYAFETIKKGAIQRRNFRQTVNELNSLSDRELNDLGLCRSMINDVARSAVYQ